MTDLKKLSEKELFSLFINRLNVSDFIGSVEYETELLRRLSEGSKAIKILESMKSEVRRNDGGWLILPQGGMIKITNMVVDLCRESADEKADKS